MCRSTGLRAVVAAVLAVFASSAGLAVSAASATADGTLPWYPLGTRDRGRELDVAVDGCAVRAGRPVAIARRESVTVRVPGNLYGRSCGDVQFWTVLGVRVPGGISGRRVLGARSWRSFPELFAPRGCLDHPMPGLAGLSPGDARRLVAGRLNFFGRRVIHVRTTLVRRRGVSRPVVRGQDPAPGACRKRIRTVRLEVAVPGGRPRGRFIATEPQAGGQGLEPR